jgi:ABC-type lipoprotein release transport system permease subunit
VIVRLAWRNVWRSKRRSLITLSSVAVGLWLTVMSVGIADFSYAQMINDSARLGFGHVTIQPEGYRAAPSLELRLEHAVPVLDEVRGIEGVDRALTRIIGQAMFQSARKSVGGMFMGVNPADEDPSVNVMLKNIIEGEMFESTDGRGALVGQLMVDKLQLGLGKKFVLTAIDKDGEIVSELFRVRGIFRTGVVEIDGSTILVPIDRARSALRYEPDAATMISVYIPDYREAHETRRRIEAKVGGSGRDVATWRETQSEMASLSDLDRGMNYLLMGFLGLLIAAGVLNTALMSVLERRPEFGKMMALGMRPAQLGLMVLVESVFIGLVGLLVGVIISVPWVWYMYEIGIDFSGAMPGDYSAAGVLVDPVMHIRLYPDRVAGILVTLFALTLTAASYPAWIAGRITPKEALQELT